MTRWTKFRNIATQEAMKSSCTYKHGAVIMKGGKVVARGHNSHRTKFLDKLDYCQHAEMSAATRFITDTVRKKEKRYCFVREK